MMAARAVYWFARILAAIEFAATAIGYGASPGSGLLEQHNVGVSQKASV
jgi:hypothetical protein